jgi:multidrug transporter EmrE-like cation transporter
MMASLAMFAWVAALAASVAFDAGATAYLKVAGDRMSGLGFLWAAVGGVVAFTPSIILFGYAVKTGPSYIATVGIWAAGVCAANAVVGIAAFGEPFGWRAATGVAMAGAAVVLLKPT